MELCENTWNQMKWEFEAENKKNIKALKDLKSAIERGYGKPCKRKAVGCSTCLAWGIYDLAKSILY